jgi:hypothetical protein
LRQNTIDAGSSHEYSTFVHFDSASPPPARRGA